MLRLFRNKAVWLIFGGLCFLLAVRAYSGEGVSWLFDGSSVRLLFAALAGIGFSISGYWFSRSVLNARKPSRVLLPIVIGSTLLTAGAVVDVRVAVDHYIGAELVGALAYLVVASVGLAYIFSLKKKKSGQFGKVNQPGS